jgi:mono/diheme cytochrome c family protein
MKNTRILAVALFLGAAVAATHAADGKATWEDQCAKCHGSDAKGDTKMGKKLKIADLSDAKVQAGFTDEAAVKAVKEGVKDKSGKQSMKPIEGLSDDDIKAVIAYLRTLKK